MNNKQIYKMIILCLTNNNNWFKKRKQKLQIITEFQKNQYLNNIKANK